VPLKQNFGGRHFRSDEKMQTVVREWLPVQETLFYSDGIYKLMPQWEKRINIFGNCVEN
jgi:hypothetical protein